MSDEFTALVRLSVCMGTMILITLVSSAMGAEVQVNLALNGGFEDGFSGWRKRPLRGGALTKSTLDAEVKRSGRQALCVTGNRGKAGVFREVGKPPPCQALRVHYWGKIEKSPELAAGSLMTGVDLGVTLDDGQIRWFLPSELQMGAGDVGRWVEKSAWYQVPEGRKIQSISIHCINYRNSGRVWFDDIEVVPVRLDPAVRDLCVVQPMTERGRTNLARIKQKLESTGRPFSNILPLAIPRNCKLLVLSEFPESDQLYREVRNYFYADGGKILACGLANNRHSDGIRRFLWNQARPKSVATTSDGRAVYYPTPADLPDDMEPVIKRILAAREKLPEKLDALSFPTYRKAEIQDACLYLDGRPRFLRAMGAFTVGAAEDYERRLAEFRAMELNSVVAYIDPHMPEKEFVHFLDTAEKNEMLVIVWFRVRRPVRESGGLPWKAEWLLRFLKCRKHPALLSWLMSDDTADKHYPAIERIHDLIKYYDDDNFTTATCFGFRHPDRITPERWQDWRGIMDYPTTYDYPLNKENKFWKANLCVGLEGIQRLSENVPRVYGKDTYFHLWAQSHLQTHVKRTLGLSGREDFLTSPEQTRLLTYMMITAGARGILYFHAGAFTDERLGAGRRNEMVLVWRELGPFEEFIAAGHRRKAVSVSRADVEAVTFSRENQTLLVLVKHGKQYHRYVSDGNAEDVTVTLKLSNAANLRAWRVGYPGVTPIETRVEGADVLSLQIGNFDLTDLVLIGPEAGAAAQLSEYRKTTRSTAAEFAYRVCRDKKIKTDTVLAQIAAAGGKLGADVEQLRAAAEREFTGARAAHARQDFAKAYATFRALLETYREIQKRMVTRAETEWSERKEPAAAEKFLNMYYTLPSFHAVLRGGQPLPAGELGQQIKRNLATWRLEN
ncbi:MAG: hypothetical protein KAI66_07785, partial [Lentisphaeria bacterium]|nr:hypothetical protein [Lentisphaeria bacterium]